MADDGSSGWESTLQDLVSETLCCGAAVGDSASGYLYAHLFAPGMEEEFAFDFNNLYAGETYSIENLADDMVTKTLVDICETSQVKQLCDTRDVPQSVHIGKKKLTVIQLDDFAAKSYNDKLIKTYLAATGKLNACIAIDGAYFVIGFWDSQKKPDARPLIIEQVCDMAAYLGSS